MENVALAERWPAIASCAHALTWLEIQVDLGLSPRTIDAYARALADCLTVCRRDAIDPLGAGRSEIAHYVRDAVRQAVTGYPPLASTPIVQSATPAGQQLPR